MLKDIFNFDRRWFEFVSLMTEKEIKSRYKHAYIGFLWAFLNPILQMLIMGIVFNFFVPVKVDNYFMFLLSGLLPWNFFSQTLSKSIPSIVYERSLIQKSKFPRESIVISVVLSNMFHLLISILLFIIYLLIFENIYLTFIDLVLIVVGISLLMIFTTGLSLLFSSLNVKFRDINFFVQALLPLWFYATPIVYTPNLITDDFRNLLYLNPMTLITDIFHIIIGLDIEVPIHLYIFSFFVILLIFLLGVIVFSRESKFFDDWI